jgi:hypothetical protein
MLQRYYGHILKLSGSLSEFGHNLKEEMEIKYVSCAMKIISIRSEK